MAKQTEAVAKREEVMDLEEVPEFMKGDEGLGTENIGRDDVLMPRLNLAQGLSPELIEGDPKYIEGLKNGDAFNSLTGHIYGKGAIEVIIIRADKPRAMEFDPTQRGVIKDFDVPLDDPRMEFTTDKEGKRKRPIATKFYEYVAIILPTREVVALSFKGAAIKLTAKRLNGLIKAKSGRIPLFGVRYKLFPTLEQGPKGTYSVFRVENAGPVKDQELYQFAKFSFDSIKNATVKIEREPGADDDAD